MSDLNDLISQIPMDQIAGMLGVSPEQAEQSVRMALPALLGGMAANAKDPAGEASLAQALGQHASDDPFDIGGVNFDGIDTDDGGRIVDHIFGGQRDAVVDRLSGQQSAAGGLSGGMLMKLLPLLAPLVMKWLAGMFKGRAGAAPAAGSRSSGSSTGRGGDLSDAFDDMTTGEQAPAPSRATSRQYDEVEADEPARSGSSGGGLGDLLGGLLGGGSGGGGGGLGDLLGGLLGGGRR